MEFWIISVVLAIAFGVYASFRASRDGRVDAETTHWQFVDLYADCDEDNDNWVAGVIISLIHLVAQAGIGVMFAQSGYKEQYVYGLAVVLLTILPYWVTYETTRIWRSKELGNQEAAKARV